MSDRGPARAPEAGPEAGGEGRISLLDWKAANKRNSWLLALFMFALLGGIGYLIGYVFDPAQAGVFTGIALLLAGGQNAVAYFFSDKIALATTGARDATREEHRYLVNVTEAVAIGAGVPTPKIWVIDNPAPNAFATGRNPENGAIAVTTGLMELLDRQELEGVIAHEMAHIKNYDIRFGSMLMATVGAIILLRDLVLRGMRFGALSDGGGSRGGGSRRSSSDNRNAGAGQAIGMILLILLLVLAPLLATLMHLAVSRRREYLADASGAYITRNPEGLARALEKLQNYSGEPIKVSDGVRHMFFINPVRKFNAEALGSTHPPIGERIKRLRAM